MASENPKIYGADPQIITLGKRGTDPSRRSAMGFLFVRETASAVSVQATERLVLTSQPSHHYTEASFIAPKSPLPPLDYPTSSTSTFRPNLLDTPDADIDYIDDASSPSPPSAPTSLLPKLFGPLAERYRDRPGGYTRILKFGRRPGDNAPVALLSLVDGPRDVKVEMVARAVGKESLDLGLGGVLDLDSVGLRERTRRNLDKILKFKDWDGRIEMQRKAEEYAVSRTRREREGLCSDTGYAGRGGQGVGEARTVAAQISLSDVSGVSRRQKR